MRILHLNKYYQHTSGGDRFFFDAINIQAAQGHEVIPFCLDYPGNRPTPFARYFPPGVDGRSVDTRSLATRGRLFFNGIYSFEARKALRNLLREHRPDVAHLHVLHFSMSPSVIDELADWNVPMVFSLHDYRVVCTNGYLYRGAAICQDCRGGRYHNGWIHGCYRQSRTASLMGTLGHYLDAGRKIYDQVALFTVPHAGMRDTLVEWGMPEERFRILRNPLIQTGPAPESQVGDYQLYFGTLGRQKGVMTLLQAAAKMRDVKFVLCGIGDALDDIHAFIGTHQMTNVTVDTTTRRGKGLEELISSAGCIISPSEWLTPLEYSTLEAMWAGKAVVASSIGGNSHVIEDGVSGRLFEVGNHESLASTLYPLVQDPAKCLELGRNARARIESEFSEAAFHRASMDIYDEARQIRLRQ
jgi:glycosyltransferase involved in cell wall biosynthesis